MATETVVYCTTSRQVAAVGHRSERTAIADAKRRQRAGHTDVQVCMDVRSGEYHSRTVIYPTIGETWAY